MKKKAFFYVASLLVGISTFAFTAEDMNALKKQCDKAIGTASKAADHNKAKLQRARDIHSRIKSGKPPVTILDLKRCIYYAYDSADSLPTPSGYESEPTEAAGSSASASQTPEETNSTPSELAIFIAREQDSAEINAAYTDIPENRRNVILTAMRELFIKENRLRLGANKTNLIAAMQSLNDISPEQFSNIIRDVKSIVNHFSISIQSPSILAIINSIKELYNNSDLSAENRQTIYNAIKTFFRNFITSISTNSLQKITSIPLDEISELSRATASLDNGNTSFQHYMQIFEELKNIPVTGTNGSFPKTRTEVAALVKKRAGNHLSVDGAKILSEFSIFKSKEKKDQDD